MKVDWKSTSVLQIAASALLVIALLAAGWAYMAQSALSEKEAAVAAAQETARRATDAAEAKLKARENELRAALKKELEAREVEVNRNKGQVSVRVQDRILFATGSASIRPEGEKVLEKLFAALAKGSETIRIEGHTDAVPISEKLKDKYPTNWELSTARASSVVRYLSVHGQIDARRMEAVGFGQYRPVASNDKPDTRQRNRRVEIVLAPGEPLAPAEAAKPQAAPAKSQAPAPAAKPAPSKSAPAGGKAPEAKGKAPKS